MIWIAVMLGGAVGALARFVLTKWLPGSGSSLVHPGILAANVLGCFLMGYFFRRFEGIPSQAFLQTLILTGVMGSLTTFSTYALEIVTRSKEQGVAVAALVCFLHLALGIAAVMGGMKIGTLLTPKI